MKPLLFVLALLPILACDTPANSIVWRSENVRVTRAVRKMERDWCRLEVYDENGRLVAVMSTFPPYEGYVVARGRASSLPDLCKQ